MSHLPARSRGVMWAAATAVISGFSVFVNGYGVRAWAELGGPTTYTTFKNLVAALVLGVVAAVAVRSRSARLTRPSTRSQRLGLVAIAVIGGSIPFALFFEGLARASSAQAAFLHKTLVVWVAVLAVVFLRERLTGWHLGAIGLLVAGQIALTGGLGGLEFGSAEAMILAATLLWSTEVVWAKRLLVEITPLTIGLARLGGGVVVLLGWGLATGGLASLGGIEASHLGWLLLTGAFLAAYVGTWLFALSLAPAVDVTAVLVGGALITAALKTGIAGAALPNAVGLALVGCGAVVAGWAATSRPRTVDRT